MRGSTVSEWRQQVHQQVYPACADRPSSNVLIPKCSLVYPACADRPHEGILGVMEHVLTPHARIDLTKDIDQRLGGLLRMRGSTR